MMKGLPSRSSSFCATRRASWSEPPPAANSTTMVTGRDGYCWAPAGAAASVASTAKAPSRCFDPIDSSHGFGSWSFLCRSLARQRMLFEVLLILRLDVDLQRAEEPHHSVVECNRQREVDDLLAAERL